MSRRLMEKMNRMILVEGAKGKAKLALAAGKSERMIDRYRQGKSKPSSDVVVQLALACGCTEQEALALASEGLPRTRLKKAS